MSTPSTPSDTRNAKQTPSAKPATPKSKAAKHSTAPAKATPERASVPEPATTDATASKAVRDATATGEALVALAKRAEKVDGANVVAALSSTLASGTLPHADLVALRDAVNALAATLREAKQSVLARQLALANRAVRRLERAARGPRAEAR